MKSLLSFLAAMVIWAGIIGITVQVGRGMGRVEEMSKRISALEKHVEALQGQCGGDVL